MIIFCIVLIFIIAFILAKFIDELYDRIEQLEIKNGMNTRIISKQTEQKLLSVSSSLIKNLQKCNNKTVLLAKMKEADKLFDSAIKELEAEV